MGASNSKAEEDQSLKLCRDRKKYVEKALDSRFVLAEAHVNYMQSLKDTGRTLREFFEPEGSKESDLHASTDRKKEPLVPNEGHSNGSSPGENEEKVASPFAEKATVPNASLDANRHPNENHESVSAPSPPPAETSPWDFFDLSHPVGDQVSSRKINGCQKGFDRGGETKTKLNAEDEGNANDPNLNNFETEGEEEINVVLERNNSKVSTKDHDKPLPKGVVDSFENINLASEIWGAISSPSIDSASTEISEVFPMGRSRSPDLSPLREVAPSVSEAVNLTKLVDIEEMENQENTVEHKVSPRALYSMMKDIDQLFLEASECGREVLRMLEANRLHFRPVPKQKGDSKMSWCLVACFSHQVPEEPGLASKRYLSSQRNVSARSFSSIGSQNPRDDVLANSSNDIYCMASGSHVSTLERLYAWEKKLYDEVKASQVVRRGYDLKCRVLRHQEDKAVSARKVDKTRAVIKDLHSRIRVSIKRMETISSRIIRIRDSELQPQFEELIKGLCNMWKKMHEYHKTQYDMISAALSYSTEIAINSENRQLIKYHLEQQLSLTSSAYTRLIYAYRSYLEEIEGWLQKCVLFPENSSKKTTKHQHIPISKYSPPIFVTCRMWLEGLEKIAAETSRLSPHEDKHHAKKLGNTENSVCGSDNFSTILVEFFSNLKTFSESSAIMYNVLDKSVQEAISTYEQFLKSHPS